MYTQVKVVMLLCMSLFFIQCQPDTLQEINAEPDIPLSERQAFPDLIPLPDGFQPEGIVSGSGTDFYVGSLRDGSIYKGDLRTGAGTVFHTPTETRIAVGLDFDARSGYLFVAGGPVGNAYVIDTRTGEEIASYDLGGAFVNDVIVTREAAYFTDSFAPVYYKIPLDARGGLSDPSAAETIVLNGFTFNAGGFNANGIEATPDGQSLIIVNSGSGELFLVDADTGDAELIDLNGDSVTSGDGILLRGKTLYVVRNFFNEIAVVSLSSDYTSGMITETLSDPDFRIPTTVTRHGGTLYAVNARFNVAPTPTTEYNVVRVDK